MCIRDRDIVDDAERRILEVAKDERKSDFIPIGEAVQHALEEINEKFQNKQGVTGLSTGFAKLDAFTSGFQKGDFIIIAARPSMGKTAFVLNIAKNKMCIRDRWKAPPVPVFHRPGTDKGGNDHDQTK